MDKNEVLKLEVRLLYRSEISGAYVEYCTIKEFFEDKMWKEKRLLSAQLDEIEIESESESDMSTCHGTGPK